MHRSTPANTLHRSHTAGGSRTCIDQVDDKPLMQEMSGNFMKGESRKEVESPQNYGFTSVVRDATKGQDGGLQDCAEGFITFLGGNRSIPICTIMDDRRFRLKELEKGDVAMFDYLQHQIHFNNDGMFVTGRTDKKLKLQLAPPPQQNQQSSGSSGSQKGQKKRYDQTTKQYLEMTKDSHNLVHDQVINHQAGQTINYQAGLHSFQSSSSATTFTGGNPLVQIFGNKFTAGLGYFMKQVTAAQPFDVNHVVTLGHFNSVLTALGFTIPSIPSLPLPSLPPGVTLPPGFTLPTAATTAVAESDEPPLFTKLLNRIAELEQRVAALESR